MRRTVEKLKIACPLTLKGCMLGNLRGSETQDTRLREKTQETKLYVHSD